MERRNFIKQCSLAGMVCVGLPFILESCGSLHYVQGIVADKHIQVYKSDFLKLKEGATTYRKYIVVKFEGADYPIIVYRNSETEYTALLLSCTHQGNELNVNGDILTCTAHGSEFSNKGEVLQGPAEQKLKSFPVTSDEKNIYIQLS